MQVRSERDAGAEGLLDASTAEQISQDTCTPLARVEAELSSEIQGLLRGARITDFIDVIAMRRVRLRLRTKP